MEIYEQIKRLSDKYSVDLSNQIESRVQEMKKDDNSHYMLYNVLGISEKQGYQIDLYQNVGRFLYKYAGSFLEEATIACFKYKYPQAQEKVKIENTFSSNPKKVEIDCLVDKVAFEIKWRDATTDGDHITKEHNRVKVIKNKGYMPVRIMFFEPNRKQAIKIQERLRNLYENELGGKYYSGESAWNFVKENTEVDLKSILYNIIVEKQR